MSLAKINKFIKNRKGFVLVDSMVAVLILAIGLVGVAVLFTQGVGTFHKGSTREKAVHVAAAQIEKVKAIDNQYSSVEDLKNYIASINTKESAVQTDSSAEKYNVKLALCTPENANENIQTIGDTKLPGDAYVYPLTINVSWSNGDTGTETFNFITYVTLKPAS